MKKVRVRYAPSPTGQLHIGGARTALFNYLFAKHYNGDFIFRLEDTDIERNIEGGEASQLDNLIWLGITPDESPLNPGAYGPYRQMERLETYQKYAQELVDKGLAYECYCTTEALDESRKRQEAEGNFSFRYEKTCVNLTDEKKAELRAQGIKPTIRININPESIYKWNDIVRGEVVFEGKDISDWVILKSSGIPTYNFAVVIDDYLMEISHVFRGEEHTSNTPKQLMIYEAFNWEAPEFGHMTLIVNEERKKLSKRDETIMQFISQYREQGYLPEAMFNFFSLLGWSPEGEKEIFDAAEIISLFDEKRLSKSPSMYDKNKLNWVNNQYIKNQELEVTYNLCLPYLESAYDLNNKDKNWLLKLVELFKPQLNYGMEIVELVEPFFQEFSIDENNLTFLREVDAKPLLQAIYNEYTKLDNLDGDTPKQIINDLGKQMERKGKTLFMPARLGITGNMKGADLLSTIQLYGKEKVLNNLLKVIELV